MVTTKKVSGISKEFHHKGPKTPRNFPKSLSLGVLVVKIFDEFRAIGLLGMNSISSVGSNGMQRGGSTIKCESASSLSISSVGSR